MPYVQLYYHIVWATKDRQPLITPTVESILYGFMRSKAIGLEGIVFAIGGDEEHVHLVTSIPPKTPVATFIGQVKGVASARLNQGRSGNEPKFAWQEDYGVFSFDRKRLPYIIAYVEKQKEHHARKTTIPILERMTGEWQHKALHEAPSAYLADYDNWLEEMSSLEIY